MSDEHVRILLCVIVARTYLAYWESAKGILIRKENRVRSIKYYFVFLNKTKIYSCILLKTASLKVYKNI